MNASSARSNAARSTAESRFRPLDKYGKKYDQGHGAFQYMYGVLLGANNTKPQARVVHALVRLGDWVHWPTTDPKTLLEQHEDAMTVFEYLSEHRKDAVHLFGKEEGGYLIDVFEQVADAFDLFESENNNYDLDMLSEALDILGFYRNHALDVVLYRASLNWKRTRRRTRGRHNGAA